MIALLWAFDFDLEFHLRLLYDYCRAQNFHDFHKGPNIQILLAILYLWEAQCHGYKVLKNILIKTFRLITFFVFNIFFKRCKLKRNLTNSFFKVSFSLSNAAEGLFIDSFILLEDVSKSILSGVSILMLLFSLFSSTNFVLS